MTHGDDHGLVCPPRLAQWQVVHRADLRRPTRSARRRSRRCSGLRRELKQAGIRRVRRPPRRAQARRQVLRMGGRGVPFRLELGPRDLASRARCWRGEPAAGRSRCRWTGSPSGCTAEMDRDAADAVRHRRRHAARRIPFAEPARRICWRKWPATAVGIRVRWLLRERRVRGGDQGADQGDDPRASGSGVPLARASGDVPVV